MTSKELAEAHWRYIESLLNAHGSNPNIMELIEFHYNTAFIHGYKHGQEDMNDISRVPNL